MTVQDFGIGIPDEDIPHVTNRFYRVEKSRNRKKGGYGIGLSIAQKLMDAYMGSLIIESQLDNGTTITLTFPKSTLKTKKIKRTSGTFKMSSCYVLHYIFAE